LVMLGVGNGQWLEGALFFLTIYIHLYIGEIPFSRVLE